MNMAQLSSSLVWYALLALGLFNLAGAQGLTRGPPVNVDKPRGPPQSPGSEYFWRRYGCSIAVLGDNLYIEGGKVFQNPGPNASEYSYPYQLNKTIYISLTSSWAAKEVSTTILENYDMDESEEVALWPSEKKDDNKLYRWGGTVYDEDLSKSRPALAVLSGLGPRPTSSQIDSSGSWSNNSVIPSAIKPDLLRTTAGSWTTCNGQGFLLGGTTPYFVDTASNRAPAVPGLITLDMEKGEMSNVSAAEFGPPGVARGTHRRGSAVCLPTYGTENKGIVMFLAGEQQANFSSSQWSPMNLSTVYMYDIATQTFHNQTTTGDIPAPRERPCAVATHKKDGRSYEIFLWGGKNSTEVLNDLYVLTVPGFTWMKIPHFEEDGRYQHSCAIVGKGQSQMLNVGGLQSISRREDSYGVDNWSNGLKIFDLTKWFWRDNYDPNAAAYEPNEQVQNWYSSQSNLQSVQWTDDKTKALFPLAAQTDPTNNPGGSGQPETPRDDGASRSSPVGAIVGGVVGGVVLLAAAILFFILRRRRLRRKWAAEQKAHDEQSNTDAGSGGNQGSPVNSPDSAMPYDKQMLDSNQVHELPPQGKSYEMGNDGAISEMPPQEKSYEMGNDGALSEVPGGATAYYYQLDDGTIVVEMPHSKDVPVEMAHNQEIQPQELSADSPQRHQAGAESLGDPRGETDVRKGTGVSK
ncbi:hypothetical protein PspLS_00734 [Pyricularia sp. CBS 133598]|nr:hypothetical protein PspLS_00734 [Pyricularia sp. CBS 133598]